MCIYSYNYSLKTSIPGDMYKHMHNCIFHNTKNANNPNADWKKTVAYSHHRIVYTSEKLMKTVKHKMDESQKQRWIKKVNYSRLCEINYHINKFQKNKQS